MDCDLVMFYFFKLSFLKLAYGFYALVNVSRGMEKIGETVRRCEYQLGRMTMRSRVNGRDLKEIRRRIRYMIKIKLRIGPYGLGKSVPLQGSLFYVNNYATAALWPRN